MKGVIWRHKISSSRFRTCIQLQIKGALKEIIDAAAVANEDNFVDLVDDDVFVDDDVIVHDNVFVDDDD